jgi:hypothetical protein
MQSLISIDDATTAEEVSSEPAPISDEPIVVDKILLVNTENVTNDEYEQTAELKVGENYF